MIWHIFKKDLRLLWPLSLAVMLVGVLGALRIPLEGQFHQPLLERLTFFLPYLLYAGIAIVAVTVVHQDALSGSQEDWLVRPLLRRHLVLAKVLFVLLTVHLPLMSIDVLQQLMLQFPLSVSLGVAGYRALIMLALISLPGLMLGAVTRSLVDAFVFGAIAAIGIVFIVLGAVAILSADVLGLGRITGMEWVSLGAAGVTMVVGSAASLAYQYSTRRVLVARGIGFAAALAAIYMFILLPSTVTLAVQELLWGSSNSGSIRLSFDPTRHGASSGQEPSLAFGIGPPTSSAGAAGMAAVVASVGKEVEKVRLPLTISGMRQGDVLLADRIDVRIVSMTGMALFEGAGVCTREANGVVCLNNRLEVWASSAGDEDVPHAQELNLPKGLYERLKDEAVRVEVTYALSRFVARPTQTISAAGDRKAFSEMGSCATRIDGDDDEVELGCVTNVGIPSCARVVLEDPQTNRRNPELRRCDPQYAPYRRGRLLDAVLRSGLSIPFRDPTGLVHYPVDGAAIARARIDVTAYDPVEHFRTSVVVPSIQLVNWTQPKRQPAEP